jgi:ABC-type spermidine/putrescine transport system permease subunit II
MRARRTRRFCLGAIVLLVFVFLYAPIVAVVLMSFGDSVSVLSLRSLTLRWYVELMNDRTVIDALWLSLRLALVSTLFATVMGTLAAIVLVRRRFRGRNAMRTALYTPMIVPEVVSAVALLVLFAFIGLPRGWPTLLVGHTLLLLPYVVSVVSSQLYGFDWSIDEAASSLGARPLRSFAEIVLPLLAPSVIGAALLAFKVSFNEVVGALFWSSLREKTLPAIVFAMLNWELTPKVNAIGTIMIALTLLLLIIFWMLTARRSRGQQFS